MAVRNLRGIKPIVWIPPNESAGYKITVEPEGGAELDITDLITTFRVEDGVTDATGIFEFEIPNPNETYTDLWTGMEVFRFYADYEEDPVTLKFRGRIEKASNKDNSVVVTGRSESLFVVDQTITQAYEEIDAGVIIKDFFDTYGQGRYDTSSIPTDTGILLTLNFIDTPFWDAIGIVGNATNYDCYVDAQLVVQFFLSGSVENTTDGVVHGYNIWEVGDFAEDLQFVRNKIRVYGASLDDVQIMYTANDFPSQDTYGIRKRTESDDTIVTYGQAKEVADYLLSQSKDPPLVSDVKCFMIPTILPGETLWTSDPQNGIAPLKRRIIKYKHEFGNEGVLTTITINKEPRTVSHIIKERILREHKKQNATTNPNDLDFSTIELFNAETGSHSNTEIVEGVLKLVSGENTGTWTSDTVQTADLQNVLKVSPSVYGDNLPGVTIEVSANNGLNYILVSREELATITITGKAIKIKLGLSRIGEAAESAQVDSMQLNYNTVA
jgi:hypothetical protein